MSQWKTIDTAPVEVRRMADAITADIGRFRARVRYLIGDDEVIVFWVGFGHSSPVTHWQSLGKPPS